MRRRWLSGLAAFDEIIWIFVTLELSVGHFRLLVFRFAVVRHRETAKKRKILFRSCRWRKKRYRPVNSSTTKWGKEGCCLNKSLKTFSKSSGKSKKKKKINNFWFPGTHTKLNIPDNWSFVMNEKHQNLILFPPVRAAAFFPYICLIWRQLVSSLTKTFFKVSRGQRQIEFQ